MVRLQLRVSAPARWARDQLRAVHCVPVVLGGAGFVSEVVHRPPEVNSRGVGDARPHGPLPAHEVAEAGLLRPTTLL